MRLGLRRSLKKRFASSRFREMLGFSIWHITVVALAVLVFIGPKEIPKVMRLLGRAAGQIRRLSAEFQAQFNELLREAELAEERAGSQSGAVTQQVKRAADSAANIEPEKRSGEPSPGG